MSDATHYVIRGGVEGRERLRLLGRVMHPTSSALFDRLGLRDGLSCLDAGCGGGDATRELARRVGPHGRVVGADIDSVKLDLARAEAAELGMANVSFEEVDLCAATALGEFDVVYSRFLLTHLSDPARAVAAFRRHLRSGGMLAVEDIDFRGHFSYPESAAFARYQSLYCASVRKRGGDPDIGPRLPMLLKAGGFDVVGVSVVQPAGLTGEVKLLTPLTMENIKGPVLADGLATEEEVAGLVRDLYEFAQNPDTLLSTPRIVQVWAKVQGA